MRFNQKNQRRIAAVICFILILSMVIPLLAVTVF